MSITLDARSPNLEWVPWLWNITFWVLLGLNAESIPNKWPLWYILIPSQITLFWSIAPPLTVKPVAVSFGLITPGNNCMLSKISASISPGRMPNFSGLIVKVASLFFSIPFVKYPVITTLSSNSIFFLVTLDS